MHRWFGTCASAIETEALEIFKWTDKRLAGAEAEATRAIANARRTAPPPAEATIRDSSSEAAMTAEEIARALGGATRLASGGWSCKCPAHDDATPSLSLDDADNEFGLLWDCHANCSQEAVLEALRDRGLIPPRPDFYIRDLGEPSIVWDYYDLDGAVAFHVARYEPPGGKQIRPWRRAGSELVAKAAPAPRVLYRLPELLADARRTVLVVEGELCADAAARALGNWCAVTTWSGGAKAWHKSAWDVLALRKVALWPDADQPGFTAMRAIGAKLAALGATVRYVVPDADAAPGWDCADLIAAGMDMEAWIRAHLRAELPHRYNGGAGEPDRDQRARRAGTRAGRYRDRGGGSTAQR